MQCPVCHGKGEIEAEIKDVVSQKTLSAIIERMTKSGMSLRQIGEILGIKHPQGVKYYRDRANPQPL